MSTNYAMLFAILFSVPMSEWNDKALAKLKGELKINVKMIKLSDILETAAGGFMDRAEALSVTVRIGDAEQMGQVIEILRGKGDQEFTAFCTMLRRSNYEVWANQLESSAEWFKNATGLVALPLISLCIQSRLMLH